MTLLEEAKKIPIYRKQRKQYTLEDQELVVAWLKGNISYTQVQKVTAGTGRDTYGYIAQIVRILYQEEKLKIYLDKPL